MVSIVKPFESRDFCDCFFNNHCTLEEIILQFGVLSQACIARADDLGPSHWDAARSDLLGKALLQFYTCAIILLVCHYHEQVPVLERDYMIKFEAGEQLNENIHLFAELPFFSDRDSIGVYLQRFCSSARERRIA